MGAAHRAPDGGTGVKARIPADPATTANPATASNLLAPFMLAAAAGVAGYLLPATTAIGPVRRLSLNGLSTLTGQGSPHRVALTFDDGPDPASTPAFLKALHELEVHATFFLLGRMLVRSPGLGRELVEAGHEIAVHGWDHRPLLLRGPRSTRHEIARARTQISHTCGVAPAFYRPPYGVLTWAARQAALDLGMTPVLWTTWGRDWRSGASAQSIHADVLRRLEPGGTILLHDSDSHAAPKCWLAMLGALPAILTTCRARGLEVGPLADHGL
jgi:peptidoglycan-N-acetylglucosamine deacetylase